MNIRKVPPLVLAAALQILPLCRVAQVSPSMAPTAFAIVFRCAAAVGAALGTFHAVSGATTVTISGVVKYPFNPLNPITNNAYAGVGQAFYYRIIIANGGVNTNADYFNATNLPPGLTIDTNVGGFGLIDGTATVAAVTYPVTLIAGNTIYDGLGFAPITTNITITITNTSGGTIPSFTTQPQNHTVTNGGTVSFTAAAGGSPTPTYQWRKDGTNLPGATATTYTIGVATTNHAGPYTVVASNSSGSATSQVATLTVLLAPAFTTQPQTKTALVGTSATFSSAANGIPPPAYQWRKNTTNIAGATASSYSIPAVATTDAADYTVVASNSVSAVTSQVARLNVVQVPSITGVGLTNRSINLGFNREAGAIYDVLTSPTIPSTNWLVWTNFPVIPTNSPASVSDSTTNGPTRFYQIRMTIP